jgi:hypothetical protein
VIVEPGKYYDYRTENTISAILRNRGKELFGLYTKHYQYL